MSTLLLRFGLIAGSCFKVPPDISGYKLGDMETVQRHVDRTVPITIGLSFGPSSILTMISQLKNTNCTFLWKFKTEFDRVLARTADGRERAAQCGTLPLPASNSSCLVKEF